MFVEELTGGALFFADTFFLAWLGDEVAGSVGMLGSVMLLGYFILPMFTTAGTSLASQYIGSKQEEKVVPTYIANILISVMGGLFLTLFVFLFSADIGLWFGMTQEQNAHSTAYLGIISLNFILVGARFSYASILASKTLTKWNMITSIITNILNISTNYALLTGWWIFPKLGVAGIALSTVISYLVGLLVLMYLVHFRLKINFIIKNAFQRVKEVITPLLKIALPTTLEPFSYTVQSFVVTYFIVELGTVAMSANTYMFRLIFLDITVSWTLTMAAQIIISHHLGAHNMKEVKATYRKCLNYIIGFAIVNIIIYLIFFDHFFALFTKDKEIIQTGFWLMVISLLLEPIRCINIMGGTTLKTVGDGKFAAIVGMTIMWSIIPVIIFISDLGWGIIGLWGMLCFDEGIRAGVNQWRWLSNRWIGKQVFD